MNEITLICSDKFPLLRKPQIKESLNYVKFEVSTAETMKNGVVWDVTPCGSCKNRRFGGT
jgi:hypothetical protein